MPTPTCRCSDGAFLVGPNASGKSNFLDLFRFLDDLASPGGGFREARGVSAIRCLAARRNPDVLVAVTIGADAGSPTWEYELRLYQDSQRRPLVRREKVIRDGEVLLDRPDEADKEDPERLTQTHLEQVNVNRAFRDLVGFFESSRLIELVFTYWRSDAAMERCDSLRRAVGRLREGRRDR